MAQHRWVAWIALALFVSACGQPDQNIVLNEASAATLVPQPVAAKPTEALTPTDPPTVSDTTTQPVPGTLPIAPTMAPIIAPAVPIPPGANLVQPCNQGGQGCPALCLSGPGCIATTPVPAPAGGDQTVMWIQATEKINLVYSPDRKLSDADIETFFTAQLAPQHWQRAPARMCHSAHNLYDPPPWELREIVAYNLTTARGNIPLRWCLIIAEWIPQPSVTATLPAYPVTRQELQHLNIFWGYQLDATLTPLPPTIPPGTPAPRSYPAPGAHNPYPAPGTPIAYPAPQVQSTAMPATTATLIQDQPAHPTAPPAPLPTSVPAP